MGVRESAFFQKRNTIINRQPQIGYAPPKCKSALRPHAARCCPIPLTRAGAIAVSRTGANPPGMRRSRLREIQINWGDSISKKQSRERVPQWIAWPENPDQGRSENTKKSPRAFHWG